MESRHTIFNDLHVRITYHNKDGRRERDLEERVHSFLKQEFDKNNGAVLSADDEVRIVGIDYFGKSCRVEVRYQVPEGWAYTTFMGREIRTHPDRAPQCRKSPLEEWKEIQLKPGAITVGEAPAPRMQGRCQLQNVARNPLLTNPCEEIEVRERPAKFDPDRYLKEAGTGLPSPDWRMHETLKEAFEEVTRDRGMISRDSNTRANPLNTEGRWVNPAAARAFNEYNDREVERLREVNLRRIAFREGRKEDGRQVSAALAVDNSAGFTGMANVDNLRGAI